MSFSLFSFTLTVKIITNDAVFATDTILLFVKQFVCITFEDR